MLAKLVILNGKQAGQALSLNRAGENIIGRDESCAVVLKDPACSRAHANIWFEASRWQVADRVSANGTYLNGDRVQAADLKDGDKLLVGSTWLRFLTIEERVPEETNAPPTWILEDSINPESSLTSITGNQVDEVQRRDLDCLERVSGAIAHQTDPKALVEEALKIITEHLRASGAKMFGREGRSVFAEYTRSAMPAITADTIRQALLTAEAVLVPIVDGTARSRCIFAPLKYLNQVEGVIWVAEALGRATFKHEDLCLVASIAHVLAPPLKMLLDVQQLQRKADSLIEATSVRVVGRSPAMQEVLQMVARVADVDQTVLLRGESGVGKEVVARLIHETGSRREQAMVCVNCAALAESLLESELFGHEKGAFTGATARRAGKFEAADRGTVFLDELGSMSLATQAKLLRVLDGHPFERVGGQVPIQVDCRVIGATNSDLEELVRQNKFREDLYHRLHVVEIRIPPLRQRPEDIAELAEHFLQLFIEQTGRRLALEPSAIDVLRRHDWPGNVRQLRNTIERAAILTTGPTITADSLETITVTGTDDGEVRSIDDVARKGIESAIAQSGNIPEAAEKLGMSRSALYRHMKKLNITPPRQRPT
ncbi:MAG: sigma 54-dependent Fis family transcriptional regulator [Planctomycetes bacterium]|nr:sigma 54-dependent Fis family transcriptional regulator [Planctomycetota bacterium]